MIETENNNSKLVKIDHLLKVITERLLDGSEILY